MHNNLYIILLNTAFDEVNIVERAVEQFYSHAIQSPCVCTFRLNHQNTELIFIKPPDDVSAYKSCPTY